MGRRAIYCGYCGNAFPVGTQFTPTDMDGFIGGGRIGFNYQAGMMVFGIEGEGSWSNINGSSRTNSVAVAGTFVDTDRDLKWLTTVAGRLGIANNNWLSLCEGRLGLGKPHPTQSRPTAPALSPRSALHRRTAMAICWVPAWNMGSRLTGR